MSSKFQGPKRAMKKYGYFVGLTNIGTTMGVFDMVNPTDRDNERETLTRIVGNLHLHIKVANTAIQLGIYYRPAGQSVGAVSPATFGKYFDTLQLEDGLLWAGAFRGSVDEGINIPIDVKGQRKLKSTDLVSVFGEADQNSTADLTGALVVFTKEG